MIISKTEPGKKIALSNDNRYTDSDEIVFSTCPILGHYFHALNKVQLKLDS